MAEKEKKSGSMQYPDYLFSFCINGDKMIPIYGYTVYSGIRKAGGNNEFQRCRKADAYLSVLSFEAYAEA
jgi:hypothetical protein